MEMQKAKMSMNEEEFKQHQKMKRLEAEAQEEVVPQQKIFANSHHFVTRSDRPSPNRGRPR